MASARPVRISRSRLLCSVSTLVTVILFRSCSMVTGTERFSPSSAFCSTGEEVTVVRSRSDPSGAFRVLAYRSVTTDVRVRCDGFSWYITSGAQSPTSRHSTSTQAKILDFTFML